MTYGYRSPLLLALAALVLLGAGPARAQDAQTCPDDQAVCVVEWADADGNVIVNALRDVIANDTLRPPDRVYQLKRGGFYWIEDRIQYDGFHLRLIGETAEEADPAEAFVCGPTFDQDCGPAVIQRVRREDQSVDGTMIQNAGTGSHLTAQNVWFMGQDSDGVLGAYEQISLDAADSRFVFDNVVFDRNNWHLLGPNAENVDMFVTNSVFRNLHGPSQQWEGLGVRFEVGADSVVFDNNTFLNIGYTPFQSEAAPMNYFRVNHNTFVNIGRTFQGGNIWREAYITNNLFVNPFWHGETPSEYEDPDREDPFTGFFSIGALPARFGTDFDREIVVANNSFWRDPALEALMPDSIRQQPFINDTTAGYFSAYPDNMIFRDNYIDANPELAVYPDVLEDLVANIQEIRQGNSAAPTYRWDPGRDEGCFVCTIWPLPEDFSYANQALATGGTDELPLGDLNYFPESKEVYEANQAQFVEAIEAMAEGVPLESVALLEAEEGTPNENAAVQPFDGFVSFFIQGSGFIEWTFEVPEDGTYGINLVTNMGAETQRGQRVILDDVNLRNQDGFGEYYFCTAAQDGCANPLPQNEWATVQIREGGLIEGAEALTMTAGTHTLRVEPSWGWQSFSSFDVVDAADNVVAAPTAADADYQDVQPVCEDAEYCPQGFATVALEAGGAVSFTVEAPYDGQYAFRVFYQAPDGPSSGRLLVDGEPVLPSLTFDGEAGDVAGRELFSQEFPMASGTRTITVESAQGGINVDYVQLLAFGGTTSAVEGELPDGYALSQNYPNPFNPVTTIAYDLGATGPVTLTVFDLLGRRVATLVDGMQVAGHHQVRFDGARLASGLYLYRLETAVGTRVRTMTLLK